MYSYVSIWSSLPVLPAWWIVRVFWDCTFIISPFDRFLQKRSIIGLPDRGADQVRTVFDRANVLSDEATATEAIFLKDFKPRSSGVLYWEDLLALTPIKPRRGVALLPSNGIIKLRRGLIRYCRGEWDARAVFRGVEAVCDNAWRGRVHNDWGCLVHLGIVERLMFTSERPWQGIIVRARIGIKHDLVRAILAKYLLPCVCIPAELDCNLVTALKRLDVVVQQIGGLAIDRSETVWGDGIWSTSLV